MTGIEGLLAGRVLGDRYRIEHVLGRGGMGVVYRATDVRLERAVAVKVITASVADVSVRLRLRQRFHREARAAARLQHPHVVTVHDFGTDARLDLDYLVMELLQGEDLAARLQRAGPPPLEEALEILEQATRGVAAGHRAGLIHRDLKPGNLFLVSEGRAGALRVCVLDFGIVQLGAEDDEATMTHLTVFGRAPHSPAYAAPEQLRGEPRLTPACDVWGLGVTAFQLLTGERPFTEAEQRRMLDGVSVPAPSARERNPAVPPAVDELLQVALACRPADRFRDADELAGALARARRSPAGAGAAPRRAAVATAPAAPAAAVTRGATEERTLLDADPAAPARPKPRWGLPPLRAAPAPAPEETLFASAPLPASASPPAPAAGKPRARWLRRTLGAAWQLAITLSALALAGALAIGMLRAYDANLVEPFYASVVGFTLALPWAVHRLFGRRGSYVLALIGCVVIAIGAFRFLAPLAGPHAAVLALPPAQLLAAAWIARRTRRRTPTPQDE